MFCHATMLYEVFPMRILIGCVNTAVSLIGYDTTLRQSFWYCPANVIRACGVCYDEDALCIASDNSLTRISATHGVSSCHLPGPHDNYAHSVKHIGSGLLGVVDTGNSRVLLMPRDTDLTLTYEPLQGWQGDLPLDAIHLNDILPVDDGVLASAFSYQPFTQWSTMAVEWKAAGLGVIYHLTRRGGKTLARIVASGINCPHSLMEHNGDVYCCSSAQGDFIRFRWHASGVLHEVERFHVTSTHFLRGALRTDDGWLLGGSSSRDAGIPCNMLLFHLADDGQVTELPVARVGEIYDILPWNDAIMQPTTALLHSLPTLDVEGAFPPRCEPLA